MSLFYYPVREQHLLKPQIKDIPEPPCRPLLWYPPCYPLPPPSTSTQTMGTALLLLGILAVTDRRNMSVPKGGVPAAIGLVLFGVITASGSNTGAAVNPARDFSPRLYSYAIGYHDVFE